MQAMKLCGVIILGMALLVMIGCGKTEDKPADKTSMETPAETVTAVDIAVSPEEVGQEVTCAVCGMAFTVTDSTLAANYDGKTYYFCNADDKAKFMADPIVFVSETIEGAEDSMDEAKDNAEGMMEEGSEAVKKVTDKAKTGH